MVALYDYEAEEEGELTFAEGDRIVLLEQDDSGWWKYASLFTLDSS